jgi:aspartate racemase
MKKAGIIGGAGVAATNRLLDIMERTLTERGFFRDHQHPEVIVYYATKAPSRSMYLEGRGGSFVDDYIDTAKKLKNAGADVVAMCCNTAHHAIDEIAARSGVPFINLIEKVVMECRVKANGKKCRIGLIASDGCLMGKVYEPYFKSILPEAEIIYPDVKMQREVTRGICNVKNACRFLPADHPDRPQQIFMNVCASLTAAGADMIVIGCTDIGVDFTCTEYDCVDSLNVLAASVLGAADPVPPDGT